MKRCEEGHRSLHRCIPALLFKIRLGRQSLAESNALAYFSQNASQGKNCGLIKEVVDKVEFLK